MIDDNKIINFDYEGFPICKMNIRDILEQLGCKLNKKTNKWEIKESEDLDIFPVTVVDDGMAYGVNEEYICQVNNHSKPDYQTKEKYCTIFRETQLDKLDLWKESKFFPGAEVVIKGQESLNLPENEWVTNFIRDIFKTEEGFEYLVETRKYREVDLCEIETLQIRQIKYKENVLDWI